MGVSVGLGTVGVGEGESGGGEIPAPRCWLVAVVAVAGVLP